MANGADWLAAFSTLLVGGSAVVAAIQGWRSLEAWRTETIGPRRISTAEEALADFYQAGDLFRSIRSPFSSTNETVDRPKPETHFESPDFVKRTDAFWVTLKRLSEQSAFFSAMMARRYRVMASLGPEAGKPYEEIIRVHNELGLAAQFLIDDARDRIGPPSDSDRAFQKEQRAIIWAGSRNDEIADRIDGAIKMAENFFRPHLQQK